MAQEFYLKTQALHEEYKMRELQYLKTEEKLFSNLMFKKKLNLPFQEYLQKINEREKETEETYRNIMKEIEDLDRHTDFVSQKLETLAILRNNLTSLTLPSEPPSISSHNFDFRLINTHFQSLGHNINSLFETDVKSISTQTEIAVYCDKCHSPVQIHPCHIVENKMLSISNIQSGMCNELQIVQSNSRKDSSTVNDINDNSQITALVRQHEHYNSLPASKIGNLIDRNPNASEKNEKRPLDHQQQDELLTENYSSLNSLSNSNRSVTENVHIKIMRSEGKMTEFQKSEIENYEKNSQDAETNIDVLVTKSDAESMNNEFDFLESDAKTVSSKIEAQNISESHKSLSRDADMSLSKAVTSDIQHPNMNLLKHSIAELELNDNKSETSGSISAFHSPNISGTSDSDSIYGKGSASAAYQALVAGAVIPTKAKKDDSDSESADEIESALATVVQRNHVKPKSKNNQLAETGRKPSSEGNDSKHVVKGLKPQSLNKPQSKLTKKTRKVLGLDTSSSSEIESVKPPEKNEDDSDEFNFFD